MEKIEIADESLKDKTSNDKLPDKSGLIQKVASVVAAGAILIASVGKHGDHVKENHSTRLFVGSNESEGSFLEKEIGYDLKKFAENDFITDIHVKAPIGRPYIVFIGQTHFTGKENEMSDIEEVKESQLAIEAILRKIIEVEGIKKNVYSEGSVSMVENQLINTIKSGLEKLAPQEKIFEKIVEIYQQIIGASSKDGLAALISHKFRDKIFVLVDYYSNHIEEFIPTNNYSTPQEALNWAVKHTMSDLNKKFGDDSFYLAGAVAKLAMDGLINMLPAESSESQRVAQLKFKGDQDLNSVEIKRKREDETIAIIAGDVDGDAKTRIVIYGRDHNFVESVKVFNAAHPELAVGLITLRPIK